MLRRQFLRHMPALAGLGAMAAGTSGAAFATPGTAPAAPAYENNLRDRLWMWGHDPGVYDGPKGVYNIPLSPPLSMVEGIRSMGIPNLCVIRGGIPGPAYLRQFKDVKRIAWNLSSGSNKSYRELKDFVFGLRETMPNLTGYYLDDFFQFSLKPGFDRNSETEPAPAALSQDELKRLHAETRAYRRPLDLALVLYTHQLCPAIKPMVAHADLVSLWIWSGADIRKLAGNFRNYRSLVPDKPTLLGIYMWDFGGKQELSRDFMAQQLAHALELYRQGQIEGLIFHCTPLCNKGLAAVDYARDWIAAHAGEQRGDTPPAG